MQVISPIIKRVFPEHIDDRLIFDGSEANYLNVAWKDYYRTRPVNGTNFWVEISRGPNGDFVIQMYSRPPTDANFEQHHALPEALPGIVKQYLDRVLS